MLVVIDVPSPGTRLLGRDDEVDHVIGLLRTPDVRLVTVTGPGGVGKTRVVIDVARRLGSELHDGAVFVDLAGVSDPVEVPLGIAEALDVGASGTDAPMVALRRALAPRELLLVLDNFEQVLAAAPVPVRLLEHCAGLRILVTSRAPLRVRPERVVLLGALPVPPRTTESDPAAVRDVPSVQLFCERATAIRPAMRLGDDNASRDRRDLPRRGRATPRHRAGRRPSEPPPACRARRAAGAANVDDDPRHARTRGP